MSYLSNRRFRSKRSRSAGRLGTSFRGRGRIVRGYTRRSGLYGRFNKPGRAPERKFFDITYPATYGDAITLNLPVRTSVVTPTSRVAWKADFGSITTDHMLQIPQGAGASERIGRKVFVRSMEVIGRLSMPQLTAAVVDPAVAGSTAMEETHHLWIVMDTQVNGQATDQVSQFFAPAPYNAATSVDPTSFHNIANSSRFRVLKHIVTKMQRNDMASSTSVGGTAKDIRVFLKLGLTLEYGNTTTSGAIATLRDKGIFMFTCSVPCIGACADGVTGAGVGHIDQARQCLATGILEQYHVRFRYTDV